MTLTPKIRQQLKAKAHKLKPIVFVGSNGLTANVQGEINRALNDHELIKVKIASEDRDERQQCLTDICSANHAELVQTIGRIGVLFRKRVE
jgi:RNA-binding protein